MSKSILRASAVTYIEEFWRDKPDGHGEYLDSDHEYEYEGGCGFDRSDMAMINHEYENGEAKIVKDLANKTTTPFTHVIKDPRGNYCAVILGEGDWIENF